MASGHFKPQQPQFQPMWHEPPPLLNDSFAPTVKSRPQLQPSAMPLQPVSNPINHPQAVLSPPMSAPPQPSPLKTSSSLSPTKPHLNNLDLIHLTPPIQEVFTDSPVKKLLVQPPLSGRPVCPPMPFQRPMFTTFNSNLETFEAEIYRPPSTTNENFSDFPEPQYSRKPNLKRSYSESTPTEDRSTRKDKAEATQPAVLPDPEDMPGLEDDGNKPSYSYAQMIGMAILRAPNRRLTLSQIYDWIATTFSYYHNDPKRGWHNSIRHNLSLNKAFMKVERPKSDSGKGSYWVIEPGQEFNFIKDKIRKAQPALAMGPQAIMQTTQSFAQPLAEALAPNPSFSTNQRPQTAPALPELSSDATLPASDPALDEDDTTGFAPLSPPHSSPPQALNSSPPVGEHRRNMSSPSRVLRPSTATKRKRTDNPMDDSGYFSSLESSVLRNKCVPANVLTSELDLQAGTKKSKRGRAEEEIARIRSSSIDLTPSHRRFRSLDSADVLSSSPLRKSPTSKLNPMTPSFVFKKPMRPPPSISPNSQLNLHRKAMSAFMNSPAKTIGLYGDEASSYSPAFKWPNSAHHNAFDDHFEVYTDSAATPATPGLGSSPLRAIQKRPALSRANTSNGVLSDTTNINARLNPKTPSKFPILKPTPQIFSGGSPGKDVMLPTFEHEDLFDFGHFADENSDDGEGLDLTKGFQKIGAPLAMKAISPVKKATRPALGARNNTSRF
jgi:forkhead transcription factor HCM1